MKTAVDPPLEPPDLVYEHYRLPFNRASAAERRLKGTGLCIQGNHGASTHTGTLAYALDFRFFYLLALFFCRSHQNMNIFFYRLPVGTPIICSRAGIVAAVASHFTKG